MIYSATLHSARISWRTDGQPNNDDKCITPMRWDDKSWP